MTERLFDRLKRRYEARDKAKPWVFWHRFSSSKTGEVCEGPNQERKRNMKTLCRKAGIPYSRFHALRQAGASTLDDAGAAIGTIQRILGNENGSTTEISLHGIAESEREATATLGAVLGRVPHLDSITGERRSRRYS